MNIREISTSRLREYENNPRNNDLAVEKVKYSIERFGFLFPVVVDMNYTIVCGHTRVRACREMGIQTVPCIIADELTEEQKLIVQRARKAEQFLGQNFHVAKQFTGMDGSYVKMEDTVRSFALILDGKVDEIPEQCFRMTGSIDSVYERYEKLKQAEGEE